MNCRIGVKQNRALANYLQETIFKEITCFIIIMDIENTNIVSIEKIITPTELKTKFPLNSEIKNNIQFFKHIAHN